MSENTFTTVNVNWEEGKAAAVTIDGDKNRIIGVDVVNLPDGARNPSMEDNGSATY